MNGVLSRKDIKRLIQQTPPLVEDYIDLAQTQIIETAEFGSIYECIRRNLKQGIDKLSPADCSQK